MASSARGGIRSAVIIVFSSRPHASLRPHRRRFHESRPRPYRTAMSGTPVVGRERVLTTENVCFIILEIETNVPKAGGIEGARGSKRETPLYAALPARSTPRIRL